MPLQEHYNYYVFDESGKFEYHKGASLGDDKYGFGTYEIRNDTLILIYNTAEPLIIGHHKSRVFTNKNSKIEIVFTVYDLENNITLPFTNIFYIDDKINKGYEGEKTDENGKANFELIKSNKKIEFNITLLGFKEYKLTIEPKYSYSIDVYLQKQGLGIPIKNQVDKFEINEFNEELFRIKTKSGKIETWYRKK